MTRRRAPSPRFSLAARPGWTVARVLGWVVLALWAAAAGVPPSTMPVRQADGAVHLVLCTGDGPVETPAALLTGGVSRAAGLTAPDHPTPADTPDDPRARHDAAGCPFAAAALLAVLQAAPVPAPAPIAAPIRLASRPVSPRPAALWRHSAEARAPPLLSV